MEAGSSPTRTNARPGTTPRAFNAAIARGQFALDLRGDGAAVNEIVHDKILARPHLWDLIGFMTGCGLVGQRQHVNVLDGQHRGVRPARVHAFLAGDDDVHAVVTAQIQVGGVV